MSGFSAEWLTLREPVDHRSVNADVRSVFVQDMLALPKLASGGRVSLMDIGAGTGSHLRGLSPYLGARQFWRLVDYDQALLDAARTHLMAWADRAQDHDGHLMLQQGSRDIEVAFLRADLAADRESIFQIECDAITAAAFFDLVSQNWLADFCAGLVGRGQRLYTILSYDGQENWTPPHPEDARMLAAFHAHQASDKGFGAAAGPKAAEAMINILRAAGYAVASGTSPWRLGHADRALMQALARGSAGAISEAADFAVDIVDGWLASHLEAEACEIGHIDLYARPK